MLEIAFPKYMNYGLFWKEEWKDLLNMCKNYNVKLIKEYKAMKIKKLLKSGYHEIPCEPTFYDCSILLSSKKELSFDEIVYIIISWKRKKYMLLAMSSLYYDYLEKFCMFSYKESDISLRKRLYRKTKNYFKRWYSMSLRSDTLLYPQNLLIVDFVKEHMPELIDQHQYSKGLWNTGSVELCTR